MNEVKSVLVYNNRISETKKYLKTSNIGIGLGIDKVTSIKINMGLVIF